MPRDWPASITDAFFDDVTKHLGQGPPPGAPAVDSASTSTDESQNTPAAATADVPWSQAISASTLEAEVTGQINSLALQVGTLAKFKSGGCVQAQQALTLLEVLLHVVAQYDAPVRWREIAADWAGQVRQGALACAEPTDAHWQQVRTLVDGLRDLLQGNAPAVESPERDGRSNDRRALMKRLELADQERLGPALADANAWRRQGNQAQSEAELFSLLARVIQQPHYEFAEDEAYQTLAREFAGAADQLREALRRQDLPAGRDALGRCRQGCVRCHGSFRG